MKTKKLAYFLSSAVIVFAPSHLMASSCASDLYIGSYVENSLANPEDPMPGAIHVTIPKDDSGFSGELFFTYVGCQSENIGSVTGTKFTEDNKTFLKGGWTGTVDGRPQQGEFLGKLNSKGHYTGTYTVAAGKQKVVIEDCIKYYIAPHGDWFLYPAMTSGRGEAFISFKDDKVSWKPKRNAQVTQCQLIDLGKDACVDEPKVVWQNITRSSLRSLNVNAKMQNDHSYLASCSQFDNKKNLLEMSQMKFTFPLADLPDPTVSK
jgi:hypothetical protein